MSLFVWMKYIWTQLNQLKVAELVNMPHFESSVGTGTLAGG